VLAAHPAAGVAAGAPVVLGWDRGHCALGRRGDREGGFTPMFARGGSPVRDEQVLVAEHAVVAVDHTGLWVASDHGAAENVPGGRDRQQRFHHDRLRGAADLCWIHSAAR
jgi:hypothetical protein